MRYPIGFSNLSGSQTVTQVNEGNSVAFFVNSQNDVIIGDTNEQGNVWKTCSAKEVHPSNFWFNLII